VNSFSYSLPSLLRLSMAQHVALSYTTGNPSQPSTQIPLPACELRATYRRWFELVAADRDGARTSPPEIESLNLEILKLEEATGALFAVTVLRDEAWRYQAETGRCAYCGGLPHDREDGSV